MSRFALAVLAFACALLTGCVNFVSLHPLYTEQDLVLEPALAGTWNSGSETWAISKVDDAEREYIAVQADTQDHRTVVTLHLVKLDQYRFLDALVDDGSVAVPVHVFARVHIDGDHLAVAALDTEWLRDQIIEHNEVAHEVLTGRRQGEVLLIAHPKELQRFVLRYAAEPRAFASEGRFDRVR